MSALSSATELASPERGAVHVFDRTNTYRHYMRIDPVHHELPATGAFAAVSSSLQWIVDPLPYAETGVFNDMVTHILGRGDDLGSTGTSASASLVGLLSLAWLS